jgi:helix-turn-helix protein/uncharacterized protein DUF4115
MGLVTLAALVVCGLYLWRFSDDRGLVPFLLGCALLVVAVLHAVAWRESRTPLLIADLTGLRVRLGGRWAGVPWAEIETVEVAARSRLGDGRVVVKPRDELRILSEAGPRTRLAVALNRWLYDAALVVPYGITTTLSDPDVLGSLTRLADGRVAVLAVEESAEPEPTVEVAPAGTLPRDQPPPPESSEPTPRRLAGVVSALRSQASRRSEATVPITREPMRGEPVVVGTLALSAAREEETEPLPELAELRRRAPEEHDSQPDRPTRTANVELIIDATTDLSAQAMRKVRVRPDATLPEAQSHDPVTVTSPTFDTPPNQVIGLEIRRAREWLGMGVDDLAERTRIRPYVIESLELGDFSPCGGDFYARGHLRMLSAVLGVDPGPLLATYDAHLASAPVSPRAVFDAELTTGLLRPTGRGGSRWAALVAAVLVLLLVWGLARYFLTDATPDPSSLGSAAQSSTGQRSTDSATAGPSGTLLLRPPVPPTQVTLSTTDAASLVAVWDRAQHLVFRGMLEPGTVRRVSGPGPLHVMARNAGAVSLAAAGHPKALLGPPEHRVVRRVG